VQNITSESGLNSRVSCRLMGRTECHAAGAYTQAGSKWGHGKPASEAQSCDNFVQVIAYGEARSTTRGVEWDLRLNNELRQ
jgi:hypothetical protein